MLFEILQGIDEPLPDLFCRWTRLDPYLSPGFTVSIGEGFEGREFRWPFGCPHGIRKECKSDPNKINGLRLENVGFQTLSLRHLARGQISLPEIPASKIPSICGLLCE
jgi:hypothetical protein